MSFNVVNVDPALWLLQIGNLGLLLLWHILHFFVSIWYFLLGLAYVLQSYLISGGVLKSYKALNLGKLRYLAIVIESEEAYQTLKVIELLQWLEAIGVKRVCLYDTEGVLKKSKEAILNKLKNASEFKVLSSVPTVKLLSGSTILHRKLTN
ncbi:PREDICTED: dehydrodolichyl diphosphate [Prunus dulcis]|uniref:ditrans,polycis-polyprenyl diphosphate synthase [(2E,6E)-farnesyldiphosphate specific] n=1 Tax=Prunus dulcis TaxID=3755 RepID=A0A5E4EHF2_PRUDU|nr:hypothetical protein L3X38_043452 [Prunus dulcis]VVA15123.1 PREDICTED: dehydrodolichyl diphosphate [Prunus dulcis]